MMQKKNPPRTLELAKFPALYYSAPSSLNYQCQVEVEAETEGDSVHHKKSRPAHTRSRIQNYNNRSYKFVTEKK